MLHRRRQSGSLIQQPGVADSVVDIDQLDQGLGCTSVTLTPPARYYKDG